MEDVGTNDGPAITNDGTAANTGTTTQGGTVVAPVFRGDPIPQPPDPPETGLISSAAKSHDELVAMHQPPEGGTIREFADHIDRERQMVKDWVRKEIALLVQGKSHDERAAANP